MSSLLPTVDASILRLCRWLSRYALRRRRELAAVVATMLLTTGLALLKPWPMKVLVDNGIQGAPLPTTLTSYAMLLPGAESRWGIIAWSIAATAVLFLATWALELATTWAAIGFGQRMMYDLAGDLFTHLQRLSLRFHARKSVGDSIRRVMTDTSCVSTIVKDAILPSATSIVTLVMMFSVMWKLDHTLALLALLAVPGMVLTFRRYSDPMAMRAYERDEAEGRQYTLIEQTLSAVGIVQAFNRSADIDRRFRVVTGDILNATLAVTRVQYRFKVLMGLTTAVATAGILYVGGQRALAGSLSIGAILVFLAYLGSLYAPLEALMYAPSTIQGAAGAARRVLEILETKPEVVEAHGAVALRKRVRGEVHLENVVFGYEPDRPVLKGMELVASPGETIALVGATGAGKSTTAALVPRLYDPWSGRVLLDGHDVRSLTLKALRSQVAVVLQEPFLFPMTIGENIAYGRPRASRTEIEAAARAAGAHSFIEQLPEGYDTLVGERGATLSGGERQRMAIARAFLKDAPVLVLDEPTSALDAATEAALVEALRRLTHGRTTIVIAHRLSTIRHADRIVVVADGRVAETGSHEELVRAGGLYHTLHATQLGAMSTTESAA
jgi:ATP-binding cassette, subfamily B, bacterial